MNSIIVYLFCGVIGYTLADIFGGGLSALKDIRYWIIIFSVAGGHVASLYI